jgi:hypothetical protein
MTKPTRQELEAALIEVWNATQGNWTYGGEGENQGRSPAGWVITSDSGAMRTFADIIERIKPCRD